MARSIIRAVEGDVCSPPLCPLHALVGAAPRQLVLTSHPRKFDALERCGRHHASRACGISVAALNEWRAERHVAEGGRYSMLTEVAGIFVKIVFAIDADISLARGLAHRPAGRFNRVGQDALYLSPDELSARVAIGEYVNPGDAPRHLLTYQVERCSLFDLRHPSAASVYDLARQPWRERLAVGEEPKSWDAADQIRRSGHTPGSSIRRAAVQGFGTSLG